MLTVFGYDDHGRVIRNLEIGLGHNATMTETAYNFVGDVAAENVTYYAYNEASGSVSPNFHASTTNKYDIPHTKLLGSTLYSILDITTGRYIVSGDSILIYYKEDDPSVNLWAGMFEKNNSLKPPSESRRGKRVEIFICRCDC